METDPYIDPYNDRGEVPWVPQQKQQMAESWSAPQQPAKYQKVQPAPRMSKADALNLVRSLKNGFFVASIVGFGMVSWLVASQVVAAASPQSPSQLQPGASSNEDGGFFNQQGGSYFGRHHHSDDDGQGQYQGQYQNQWSGSSGSAGQQGQNMGPVSGSHVS